MKVKIKLALLVLVGLFSLNGFAQNYNNSWFRLTVSMPILEKIKTDFEVQHRRQNDFERSNVFDKNLMYTFRTWLYYKKNKDITVALSPFAYFLNYRIIQNENDSQAKPTGEYRFSATVEVQRMVAFKVFGTYRTALEYRVFEGSVQNVVRLRNRVALRYDFNSECNATLGDEIFINVSGTDAQHVFDHNRLYFSLSRRISETTKLDFGYIYSNKLTRNNSDLISENNFYVNFACLLR